MRPGSQLCPPPPLPSLSFFFLSHFKNKRKKARKTHDTISLNAIDGWERRKPQGRGLPECRGSGFQCSDSDLSVPICKTPRAKARAEHREFSEEEVKPIVLPGCPIDIFCCVLSFLHFSQLLPPQGPTAWDIPSIRVWAQ
jgi:hypothetical protein